jgi:hypothetical protein
MTKTRLVLLLVLALPLAAAYARQSSTAAAESTTTLRGHAVRDRDVAQLSIGHSTRADVERLLGAPDARDADGALVYRADAVRRTVSASGADEQVIGTRSTTFRFDGEVLSRICRARS